MVAENKPSYGKDDK